MQMFVTSFDVIFKSKEEGEKKTEGEKEWAHNQDWGKAIIYGWAHNQSSGHFVISGLKCNMRKVDWNETKNEQDEEVKAEEAAEVEAVEKGLLPTCA